MTDHENEHVEQVENDLRVLNFTCLSVHICTMFTVTVMDG